MLVVQASLLGLVVHGVGVGGVQGGVFCQWRIWASLVWHSGHWLLVVGMGCPAVQYMVCDFQKCFFSGLVRVRHLRQMMVPARVRVFHLCGCWHFIVVSPGVVGVGLSLGSGMAWLVGLCGASRG